MDCRRAIRDCRTCGYFKRAYAKWGPPIGPFYCELTDGPIVVVREGCPNHTGRYKKKMRDYF